jgi:hypothetical protein
MYGIMGLKRFMKAHLPLLGKINELIDNYQVPPANFFPQGPDRRGRYDVRTPSGFMSRDIRAVINLCRGDGVFPTMAAQEDNPDAVYDAVL